MPRPTPDLNTKGVNMAVPPREREDRDLFYWLALRLAPGVGPLLFARFLKHFKEPEAVFQASPDQLSRIPRLPKKTAIALGRFDWGDEVLAELRRVRRLGCRLLIWPDEEYPDLLKKTADPPPVLWVLGDIRPQDRAAVAIVGSRQATEYGRVTAVRLAGELAELGVTVVSGVALGIDAAAHQGALRAGGRTLGVLGNGLDQVYPKSNRALYQGIPEAGALLSELPLGTTPEASFFPRRNRIIAGLSVAVVVVEAASRSGALITARLALEENRDVLAVPGRAGSEKSRGTHGLLKQGARLVESGREIVEEVLPQLEGWRPRSADRSLEKISSQPEMTDNELKIWAALGDGTPHMDVLGRQVGLTPARLAPILLEMELKGLVRQMPGLRYTKVF